jgi:hypothetical protein
MVYVYISTVCISTLTAHVGYLYYRFHIYIYIKFGGRVEFGYSLKLLVYVMFWPFGSLRSSLWS